MKILSHGIDLVDITEVKKWLEHPRDPFGPRCFTPTELASAGDGPNRAERLAGRFATKEAVLKALGIGFGDGVAFTDVETINVEQGSPQIILYGGAAAAAVKCGVVTWFVSVSHDGGMAVASVIAVGE
jgi:holo-[acyl-carrier protein] synthase